MRKKIGGTLVILITSVMILSSLTLAADKTEIQTSVKVEGITNNTHIKNILNRDDIVWDNGVIDQNSVGLSSQLDQAYPFNSQVADDFQFEKETSITDVHWWGVYWNPGGGPNPADFNIIFYADAGGMPTGAGMPDPTPTALKVYTMSGVMGTPFGTDQYEYDVTLPEPFVASANEHYWIAIQWIGNFQPQWGWYTNGDNPELLFPSLQGFPLLGMPYWTVHEYGDMAFYLTGREPSPPPEPKIYCEGNILWQKVKAGSTVNATFQVCNHGDPGSLLNWEVDSFPTWGTWTFTPASGTGLAEHDCVTITVEVVAPAEKKKTFTGKIKMINSDNSSDFCEIDVSLTTPRTITGFNLIQWILQKYPNMLPILRHILA
ncbi:MAG: hypothetical protein QHH15_02485 [Candidatus Thermoplasmatota archaeon]|nr:hypothetical protein [Candidatus Thermoplasmatota archaeon]